MQRVFQSTVRSRQKDTIKLLGWLVCAKRPLRWYEIQGLISLDMEQQDVDFRRQLVVDSKDLCGSLVETLSDQSLQLVHSTAKG